MSPNNSLIHTRIHIAPLSLSLSLFSFSLLHYPHFFFVSHHIPPFFCRGWQHNGWVFLLLFFFFPVLPLFSNSFFVSLITMNRLFSASSFFQHPHLHPQPLDILILIILSSILILSYRSPERLRRSGVVERQRLRRCRSKGKRI